MPSTSLLDLCVQLLRTVLRFEGPADATVSAFFREHRSLGQRDRHALAETVYVVLRERLTLLHLAQGGKGPQERRLAALAWQGPPSVLLTGLTPDEQAWLSRCRATDLAALGEAQRHNLPDWLADALREQLGDAGFWELVAALRQPGTLDLRVNTLKARRETAARTIEASGLVVRPTPYSPWGLRLEGKPDIQKLDLFRQGHFEVQDEGSQLLALMVDPKRGETVVDFCAGAGGKTLALGAAMRSTGRLYAFDVSGHRLELLKPRLLRSGLTNVHPAQIAHERDERVRRLEGKVDRVLVDAPCTGLGTLRRNPDLKWRHGPETVAELQPRQIAILGAASRLVRSGGRLVYATCSLLRAENERVAEAFEASHPEFVLLDAEEALGRAHLARASELLEGPALRLWPHRHSTDGFFAMAWQRR